MEKLFDGKFRKAITFSFDDGNIDDIRLIRILNKYGLKGTFNLNSGALTKCNSWNFNNLKEVRHINYTENMNLYDGHEVACHSYTHPFLERIDRETLHNQIYLDRKILEMLYGYEVKGMAYPFGAYSDEVIEELKNCGIVYSRTVESTYDFSLPEEPLMWHPTCHFKYAEIDDLVNKFLNDDSDGLKLFYIWGHSYELVTEEEWERFEEFCKKISNKADVYYGTNMQVLKNIK